MDTTSVISATTAPLISFNSDKTMPAENIFLMMDNTTHTQNKSLMPESFCTVVKLFFGVAALGTIFIGGIWLTLPDKVTNTSLTDGEQRHSLTSTASTLRGPQADRDYPATEILDKLRAGVNQWGSETEKMTVAVRVLERNPNSGNFFNQLRDFLKFGEQARRKTRHINDAEEFGRIASTLQEPADIDMVMGLVGPDLGLQRGNSGAQEAKYGIAANHLNNRIYGTNKKPNEAAKALLRAWYEVMKNDQRRSDRGFMV